MMRARLKESAPDHAAAFDEVEITPPDRTFLSEETVVFGGRGFRFRHLGRGHTDNDIVVEIADSAVLFAGDLIEEGNPPAFQDSFPLEWPDTVGRMLEDIAGPVVPGHGALVDRDHVRRQQRDLAAVAELAVDHHASGMSARQAAALDGPFPSPTLEHAFTRAWPVLEVGG
jgi:glyoxylase-like metal-dependent hydrolase (beta-lactamase superfamily II)